MYFSMNKKQNKIYTPYHTVDTTMHDYIIKKAESSLEMALHFLKIENDTL